MKCRVEDILREALLHGSRPKGKKKQKKKRQCVFFKDSAELPVFQVLVKNQGTSPTFQLIDTMTGLTDAGAALYLRSADYISANQQPGRLPLDGAVL